PGELLGDVVGAGGSEATDGAASCDPVSSLYFRAVPRILVSVVEVLADLQAGGSALARQVISNLPGLRRKHGLCFFHQRGVPLTTHAMTPPHGDSVGSRCM